MNREPMVVVFTGINAVLVDRSTRSLALAANAVDLLEREGVPLVLCSHSTRAEIEQVQEAAHIAHPFISGNGAALFVPIGYFADAPDDGRQTGTYHFLEFGPPHSHVDHSIERLRSMYESTYRSPVLTVGLGNGLSDLGLLREVDLPIIVRGGESREIDTLWREVPTARLTGSGGAAGWSHAVMDIVLTIQNMRRASVRATPA